LGDVMDRQEFKAEAVRQLTISANHLQDEQSGLFDHMYDEADGSHTNVHWGRGNGWVAMTLVEVMSRLDRDSAEFVQLTAILAKQAQGLIATRDSSSGLWHTILEQPDSHIDSAASAMFIYALLCSVVMNCVDDLPSESIEQSWASLAEQIDRLDHVTNVSSGTGPGSKSAYTNVERGTYAWGTGAFLIAAAELSMRK